ncbi:sensor histidine kinase [Herbidospora sp. NEAU-GS84]|uniref:Sensor histidine kinase n=1 Tax=Herbidospora solisilvae TaxID=2696284 RepID=A0A7C9NNF8_9ACTN|nr:sensor histidine kinase [Herbidospora solisilvae]NAS22896.1 sensor histidine kinase [Herbidospora solisilvae]
MGDRGSGPALVIAAVVGVASAAAVAAALAIQFGLPPQSQVAFEPTPDYTAGVMFPALGAYIAARRPRLPIGWLMIAGGVFEAVSVLTSALLVQAENGGDLDAAALYRIVGAGTWSLGGGFLAILVPLFAIGGRRPSKGWGVFGVVAAVIIVVQTALRVGRPEPPAPTRGMSSVIPNPLDFGIPREVWVPVTDTLWLAEQGCILLALVSMVVRMRGADAETRRAVAWPALTFAVYAVLVVTGDPAFHAFLVAWVALIPVSIAFSVLRHGLFGIDDVLSRTVVVAGTVAGVSAVYFATGAVFSLMAAEYDILAGLAAALFAGAFYQPLRRLIQRGMDRLLYGPVGDPRLLTARLVEEVRNADPAEALAAVVDVVRDGLAVGGAAVEVVNGLHLTSGQVGAAPRELPLVWHGEPVGRLLLGAPGGGRFGAAHDERVVATLLPYVADVAHAVRMASDLQRSRERILAAREEERRRLRRDLHDGLGQTLGAMAMTLNMARLNIKGSPATADHLLRDLRSGMDAVAGDIRELVYGLRPPALDDLGLVEAIRTLAADTLDAGTATHVSADGPMDDLPAAVEVAAYRIAQEALTNVRRHAHAKRVSITLALEDGLLTVRVADDGIGLPEVRRAGVGTASMRERAAELGGSCAITAPDTGGTVVAARLPLTGAM